jgi:glucose/arabinose dehydrogenase
MKQTAVVLAVGIVISVGMIGSRALSDDNKSHNTNTGQSAFTSFEKESPGTYRKITAGDLPAPFASESVRNNSVLVPRPADAWPKALPGFEVQLYASGFDQPRELRTAPNGDIFLSDSESGQIRILRGLTKDGKAETVGVFATGLHRPFGMAFYPPGPDPQYLYVGNTNAVVRFPYHNGDLKATGPAEVVVKSLPSGDPPPAGGGGHWTRDVVFSPDGKKMLVSVGSSSNVNDNGDAAEVNRADVLQFNPDGTGQRVYASGIRNCVGEAIQPRTGDLWCSVNERDLLGDNLPPDYITHVQEGGFYGWPWYYIGPHEDPRLKGQHPELKEKVTIPDVLLQPHNASLEMMFYQGTQFPQEFRGDIFASEHGSWNKANRAGYEVIRVPMRNGKATGEYEDFLTGFVLPDGKVWGRPVGITMAKDGSLLVSDDGSKSVWRVAYTGKPAGN